METHLNDFVTCSNCGNMFMPSNRNIFDNTNVDHGKKPYALDINQAAIQNDAYRTVIWTGSYSQVTLMSINVDDDIGLEMHPSADQFSYIVEGQGLIQMGDSQNHLNYVKDAEANTAMMIPSGTWHNVINTGNIPLKLYTIYAPPLHPTGVVERTKAEAEAREREQG